MVTHFRASSEILAVPPYTDVYLPGVKDEAVKAFKNKFNINPWRHFYISEIEDLDGVVVEPTVLIEGLI